jgi:hypothetical protein
MSRFEADLARALRRREPPRGLEQGIWARIPRRAERVGHARPGLWGGLAAAALVIMSVAAGTVYERQVRARRNEAAREKVTLTLAVATEQIARAEDKAFTAEAWGHLRERLGRVTRRRSPSPRVSSVVGRHGDASSESGGRKCRYIAVRPP